MADWKAQYLNALIARDERQKPVADLYDRCMCALCGLLMTY